MLSLATESVSKALEEQDGLDEVKVPRNTFDSCLRCI